MRRSITPTPQPYDHEAQEAAEASGGEAARRQGATGAGAAPGAPVAAPEPPAPKLKDQPVAGDIPANLGEVLAKEHQAGQPVSILASRWGFSEQQVREAIGRLGALRPEEIQP